MKRICNSCCFWDPDPRNTPEHMTGACHANSPQMPNDSGIGFWPFTKEQDWCGQWVQGGGGWLPTEE